MGKVVFIFCLILLCLLAGVVYKKIDVDASIPLPPAEKIAKPITRILSSQPQIDHIAIIVLENKPASSIMNNSSAPFLNSLSKSGSYAGSYYAVSHPSLPNYLALLGGSTFGIRSDCTDCFISATNFVDQMESAHKTWQGYMESMPQSCYLSSSYPYAQKHDPFIYFDDIRTSPERCQHIVPFTKLSQDLHTEQSTPDFIWITPNLCNDMHDCSVATGDAWLAKTLPLIRQSKAFSTGHSLIVITFDEGEGDTNQIATYFLGKEVKEGYITKVDYSHYSLLHTFEDLWGLPPLTKDVAEAKIITDIWQNKN